VHRDLGIVTEAWSPIGRNSGLRENPAVAGIAERLDKSPAQVLLRWHVQQDLVPVPQAPTPEWLKENISVFDFELTAADMESLAVLDRGEAAARDSDSPENGH
jgi:2,5-diketo-D-gluconate reductase A